MTKVNDLKNTVFDAIMEFYQEHMRPETRLMVEEVIGRKLDEKLDRKFEEKFDQHLGPMKAAIMTLEKNVAFALGDYQGQQMQVSEHEQRLATLERKVLHK